MATPIYPMTLPGVSTYSVEPTPQVLASENDTGPRAFRRRSIVPGANASVSFRYLENDYTTYLNWFKVTLKRGHKWFWIQLPSAGGLTWAVARFKKKPREKMDGHRYWTVSADLEVRERAFSPNDLAFLEDFENGFGQYTSLSGNTSIFTVRQGMSGNCMHCAPQSSGQVAEIQRVVERALCRFMSFRFRVTLANSDDGCQLTFFDGASQRFAFNPIREGYYDSLRRPKFYLLGGSEQQAYSTQVTVGEIYRVELSLSEEVDGSVFRMVHESTGVVVTEVPISGLAAPFFFDRITFKMDSGNLTSETDYDDIYIQSS